MFKILVLDICLKNDCPYFNRTAASPRGQWVILFYFFLIQELQLRVSEMEVEVSRLEVACTNEQERLAKATAAHKEEVTSLQAQLDAARAGASMAWWG